MHTINDVYLLLYLEEQSSYRDPSHYTPRKHHSVDEGGTSIIIFSFFISKNIVYQIIICD